MKMIKLLVKISLLVAAVFFATNKESQQAVRKFWDDYVAAKVEIAQSAVVHNIFADPVETPPAFSFETETSWYSRKECCTASNPNALMANGKPLNDAALTCANWDYEFGQKLKITNKANGKHVVVTVTDRGPAKRLYWQGRMIDLSKAAFARIADLRAGVVDVIVEEVK